MEKIKWGVIGTASIAKGCTIPGMRNARNCDLYAIAGRDRKKAEQFKEIFGFEKAYGSYEELLDDPDVQAVYIPLPNHLHAEWCLKAIHAGKHVLCEKPLAPSEEAAKHLFMEAEKNGVFLMEAFAYLHSPYITALKQELVSGKIGKISYIETAFLGQRCKADDYRWHKEMYGGALYDLGCYCISMMIKLLDAVPESVQAIAEYTDLGVDLFTAGYLQFPENIRGSFNCGMVFEQSSCGRMDRLYIHGSHGYIQSDVEYNQAGELTYTVCVDGTKQVKTVHADHNYQLEIENLGDAILGKAPLQISADFSVKTAGTMDMVLKAIGY